MFLEGVISLFQVTFLPGFLLLKLFDLKNDFLKTLIFSFGLSLIVNYIGVFALTSIGLYTRPIVLTFFGLELLVLFFTVPLASLLKKSLLLEIEKSIKKTFNSLNSIALKQNGLLGHYSPILHWAIIACACICMGWVILWWLKIISSICIFNGTDDVLSWNRWAIDWFSNSLPKLTQHYPQLIPTNWSISYVFMNAPLQYLPKMIMPLFMLYMLFLMFDLGINKKSIGYFLAITTTTLVMSNALGAATFTSGFVEIPIAFMSFLSIYCLLITKDMQNIETIKKYITLGIIFACGSAVIKQGGLFIVFMYPLLTYLLVIKQKKFLFSSRDSWQLLFTYISSILVIIAPFYVYKQIQMAYGLDISEITYVTHDIYEGRSLWLRLINSIKMFLNQNLLYLNIWFLMSNYYLHLMVQIILGVFYSILFYFSLKKRSLRSIFLFVLLPYSLIWGLFFCYDLRNYSIAFPLYGLSLGIGLEQILLLENDFLKNIFRNLKTIKIQTYASIFIILLALLNMRYSKNHLLERQSKLNLEWFNAKVNKSLFAYHKAVGIKDPILLEYPLQHIHLLKDVPFQKFYLKRFPNDPSSEETRFSNYKKHLKNKKIGYILLPKNANSLIVNHVKENIQTKNFKEIFTTENHSFVKIQKI